MLGHSRIVLACVAPCSLYSGSTKYTMRSVSNAVCTIHCCRLNCANCVRLPIRSFSQSGQRRRSRISDWEIDHYADSKVHGFECVGTHFDLLLNESKRGNARDGRMMDIWDDCHRFGIRMHRTRVRVYLLPTNRPISLRIVFVVARCSD